MKTIVVGYDGTEQAKRALARAAELSTALGAKVIVTSVARLLVGGAAAHGTGPIDPADEPEQHHEELGHAKAFLSERGVEGEYDVMLGDPAVQIVELAESRGADLIVVGSRDLCFPARLFGQSVSEGVHHRAHCDVLIVH